MPELMLDIGDRQFTVSCQEGEELHLQTAASVLDAEARVVNNSVGRVPESRMLLMAGLMLADKMAAVADQERYGEERIDGLEARLREAEERALKLKRDLEAAQAAPPPEPVPAHIPPVASDPVDAAYLVSVASELEALAQHLEDTVNA